MGLSCAFPLLLRPEQLSAADAHRVGGKAFQLWRLQQLAMPVPAWCVLPYDEGQQDDRATIDRTVRAIIDYFGEAGLSAEGSKADFFAVRSSGAREDGAGHSFAGQFLTELYVPAHELAGAIARVRASAHSERVRAYCRQHGLEEPAGLAVIIQRMIGAESAGVAFGLNPVTGNRRERVVSAVFGLGEGLVGGELEADTYTVDGDHIAVEVAGKEFRVVYNPESRALVREPLPSGQEMLRVLTDEQVRQVAECLEALYRALDYYPDVEFCFAEGQFYLLQARPVTAIDRLPDAGGQRVVWDNSNIVESYPGLTQPLTFSFIQRMYEAVYRQFSALMGVGQREIDDNAAVFANMLGLLRGRVYYNLLSWYRALALLPGYHLNAGFMEQMMGVRERFELTERRALSRPRAWFGVVRSAFRLIWAMATLRRRTRHFERSVEAILAEYKQIDFDACRPEALLVHYRRFEDFLVKRWKAPLINDFFAMIYFGVLQKLCTGLGPECRTNDLLAGSHDIRSTEPLRRLQAMCALIRADSQASEIFRQCEPAEIWRRLHREPALQAVAAELDDYLDVFGDRCSGELQLETVTWVHRPESLIALVQEYLFHGVFSEKTPGSATADSLRAAAEQGALAQLRGRWLRRLIFAHVLGQTRYLVSQRENLRLARTRGFGVVRSIFRAFGRRFSAEGLLEQADDIFYLTQDDIFHFIEGKTPQTDLRALVSLRRAQYARWADEPAPAPRVTTYGLPYSGNSFAETASASSAAATGHTLQGTGCCAGRVRGRARVVLAPPGPFKGVEETLPPAEGHTILVAASTDPGWITLFSTATAVVVERGSLLSHSAIVARELGIPCVVGVHGLLQRVRTGDWLEVDGTTGLIVLEQTENP